MACIAAGGCVRGPLNIITTTGDVADDADDDGDADSRPQREREMKRGSDRVIHWTYIYAAYIFCVQTRSSVYAYE